MINIRVVVAGCSEETIFNVRARTRGVQKRGPVNFKDPTPEPC